MSLGRRKRVIRASRGAFGASPAVANAIYAATGKRLRNRPLKFSA